MFLTSWLIVASQLFDDQLVTVRIQGKSSSPSARKNYYYCAGFGLPCLLLLYIKKENFYVTLYLILLAIMSLLFYIVGRQRRTVAVGVIAHIQRQIILVTTGWGRLPMAHSRILCIFFFYFLLWREAGGHNRTTTTTSTRVCLSCQIIKHPTPRFLSFFLSLSCITSTFRFFRLSLFVRKHVVGFPPSVTRNRIIAPFVRRLRMKTTMNNIYLNAGIVYFNSARRLSNHI